MNQRLLVLVLMLVVGAAGCGSSGPENRVETIPVEGRMTIDGESYGPAVLQLMPVSADEDSAQPGVTGHVNPDGTFTLQTYVEGDGAPPGTYEVQLAADIDDPAAITGGVPAVEPKTVEIAKPSDGGTVQLEIDLTSSGERTVSPLPRPGQESGRSRTRKGPGL